MIDGDGSLGVYERKCFNGSVRRIPYINITGSRNVCSQFKTFLEKEIGEPMPQGSSSTGPLMVICLQIIMP